ncbi:hypothetical protein RJ640_004933 [Escallonia rubra]|uniref:PNO1 second type I KH domain-containing protein n=1 Tax=Escallonia rubra TaxID=112253 RepID=A0AA88UHA3_9ASTE|nr:hypothetical protein RJ640_004933 [Escallonia rubra]
MEVLRVSIPPQRYKALELAWTDIHAVVSEQMQIDLRMNRKERLVELRTKASAPGVRNLQKCADLVRAFVLGLDVADISALMSHGKLYVESFGSATLKAPKGGNLSRGLARLSSKHGQEKAGIEKHTGTRIVIEGARISIVGSYADVRAARQYISHIVLRLHSDLQPRAGTAKITDWLCPPFVVWAYV